MISNFKFFHGLVNVKMQLVWPEDLVPSVDVGDELTRILSQRIADEIDNEIIQTLTRRLNGGYNQRA